MDIFKNLLSFTYSCFILMLWQKYILEKVLHLQGGAEERLVHFSDN